MFFVRGGAPLGGCLLLSPLSDVGVLILALGLCGLFSSAETALMSIHRARLQAWLREDARTALRIHALLQHPRRLLSTVLLGNTLAMVTIGVVGADLARQIGSRNGGLWTGLLVLGLTLVIVIFGEVVPKSVAATRSELVASIAAGPILVFQNLTYPLVAAVLAVTTPFIRLLGGHEAIASPRYSEDELRMLLEIGHEQGVIEEDESDLVSSALAFDDTAVADILTPRVDIVSISVNDDLPTLIRVIAREGYSRMPVTRGSIDDIVGVLHTRDVLLAAAQGEPFDLQQALHPVHVVPENKKLNDLLREFQARETQLAIVADEYGGTAGLVTLEDVLEQIVGDIRDESDEERAPIQPFAGGLAVLDSMATVEDVNDTLELALPIDGYQTIGGLVLHLLGQRARLGDRVEVAGVRITVRAIKGNRIKQLLLERLGQPRGSAATA